MDGRGEYVVYSAGNYNRSLKQDHDDTVEENERNEKVGNESIRASTSYKRKTFSSHVHFLGRR